MTEPTEPRRDEAQEIAERGLRELGPSSASRALASEIRAYADRRITEETGSLELFANLLRRTARVLGKPLGATWHDIPEKVEAEIVEAVCQRERADRERARAERAEANLSTATEVVCSLRDKLKRAEAEHDALRERVRVLEEIAREMYESAKWAPGPWLDEWRSALYPEEPKKP